MPSVTEKRPPYIPDSSHAENWITPDIFIYRGQKYQIMPGGKVERVNNRHKKNNARK